MSVQKVFDLLCDEPPQRAIDRVLWPVIQISIGIYAMAWLCLLAITSALLVHYASPAMNIVGSVLSGTIGYVSTSSLRRFLAWREWHERLVRSFGSE